MLLKFYQQAFSRNPSTKARCDERCPPVPSEYEEAVKLARKGKTVRWAASEVEV